MGVEHSTGRDSVDGRPKPGNEVNKMLIIWEAMLKLWC